MMEDGGAQAYGSEDNCSTLRVDLVDKVLSIDVSLYYTTFDACDVILRKTVITNNTDDPIALRAVASLQLDLFDEKWNFTSFDGACHSESLEQKKLPQAHIGYKQILSIFIISNYLINN